MFKILVKVTIISLALLIVVKSIKNRNHLFSLRQLVI